MCVLTRSMISLSSLCVSFSPVKVLLVYDVHNIGELLD